MAFKKVHLWKLLRFFDMDVRFLRQKLLIEAGNVIKKERGLDKKNTGGDYYSSFWGCIRRFYEDGEDLTESIIAVSEGKKGLQANYPKLEKGFTLWWKEQVERWGNRQHSFSRVWPISHHKIQGLALDLKVERMFSFNLSSDQDNGKKVEKLVYLYWYVEPVLSFQTAEIGLSILGEIFPKVGVENIKIIDIARGRAFYGADLNNPSTYYKDNFINKYKYLIDQFEKILKEKRSK